MAEPEGGPAPWEPSWWQVGQVLDAITDHVWIATAAADRVLYSNAAYEAIFGEPVARLLADPHSYLPMVAPEDRAVVQGWVRPGPHEATIRVRRADEERVIRARSFPVRDEGGRIVLVAGISEDVTEEHALRRSLAETTDRLAGIVESTSDAIVALDHEWRYTFVNRNAGDLFGRTPESLLGRHIWTEFPEGVDQPFARAYERVMATGVAETLEDHYAPWDRWFENRIFPTPEGIVIYFHEITRQKRAEVAQREQLQMLELANVVVFGFDDDRIRYWNAGAQQLYGYRPEEALGERIGELLQTEYPVPLEDAHEALRLHGRWNGTLRHRTRDGRAVTVASDWVLHRDADTGDAVVVDATSDITALVDAQREAAQLRSELNRSERLDALGQLAGGIAHDFNNLLAVMLNDLSFASDHLPVANASAHHVANARRAAERAAALTRQLLVFAQRDTSEPSDVDLDHLVRDLTPILERTAGDHIDLRVDLGAEGRTVHGDPTRFEQVLFNLVVNARDAMPYGGELTITTRPDGEDHLVLVVTDTGAGMSEEVRARAFEPFYSTKPVGQGTGLGLATVFGVATRSGGSAAIDSTVGEGTTVTVRLPTAGPEPPAPARDAPAPGRRILLIEDDDELRRSTRQVLEAAGYVVRAAASATEAERVVEGEDPPDLVVTDLMMPGPPVVELLARLRRERGELPIVAISGFPPAQQDLLAPPFTLIPKPFTREQLTGTVARFLSS